LISDLGTVFCLQTLLLYSISTSHTQTSYIMLISQKYNTIMIAMDNSSTEIALK